MLSKGGGGLWASQSVRLPSRGTAASFCSGVTNSALGGWVCEVGASHPTGLPSQSSGQASLAGSIGPWFPRLRAGKVPPFSRPGSLEVEVLTPEPGAT